MVQSSNAEAILVQLGHDDLTPFFDAAAEEALNTFASFPAIPEALLEVNHIFRLFLTHEIPLTDPPITEHARP